MAVSRERPWGTRHAPVLQKKRCTHGPGKKLLSELQAERRTWSPGSSEQRCFPWEWVASAPPSGSYEVGSRARERLADWTGIPPPPDLGPRRVVAPTHTPPLAGGTSLLPHRSVCICWAVSLRGSLEGRSRHITCQPHFFAICY